MSSVTLNILLIALIFMVGLVLGILHSAVIGIVFVLFAYFILPTVVKFMEYGH